jgi:putative transcriptional regulator
MRPAQIRRIRKELGLTQAEVAERCGVSDRTVRFWEQGERIPSGPALTLLKQMQDKAFNYKRR